MFIRSWEKWGKISSFSFPGREYSHCGNSDLCCFKLPNPWQFVLATLGINAVALGYQEHLDLRLFEFDMEHELSGHKQVLSWLDSLLSGLPPLSCSLAETVTEVPTISDLCSAKGMEVADHLR